MNPNATYMCLVAPLKPASLFSVSRLLPSTSQRQFFSSASYSAEYLGISSIVMIYQDLHSVDL
jgi:hypothetical protein